MLRAHTRKIWMAPIWAVLSLLVFWSTIAVLGMTVSADPAAPEEIRMDEPNVQSWGGDAGFVERETTMVDRVLAFGGIGVLVFLTWLLSVNRRAVKWKPVIWGIGLQLVIGLVVLNPEVKSFFFTSIDGGVRVLLGFSEAGTDFLFQTIQPHTMTALDPATGEMTDQTFIGHISPPLKSVAFWVLPTIIFFSSLMTLLYHLGVMQWIVRGVAWGMQRTMGTSGGETVSAAANIFVGQTEAPLLVKPFVDTMTRSELMAVMVGGFATVAGGVMAVYVVFLQDIPGIAGHLAIASIMSAPAALAIAKIMVPETEQSMTSGSLKLSVERPDANAIEAVSRGATEGLMLAANVAAMLVAFVAAVAMVDWGLGFIGLTFAGLLGWLFSPLAFVMGVPWSEAALVGQLLGEKLVLTELIAYSHLRDILASPVPLLSERTAVICSYALCGFANFASIGIQIGGIGGIAPKRRKDLAELGVRAMIGGAIAAMMTGTVAGMLL